MCVNAIIGGGNTPVCCVYTSITGFACIFMPCLFIFSISKTVGASRLYGRKVGLASCLLFGVGF